MLRLDWSLVILALTSRCSEAFAVSCRPAAHARRWACARADRIAGRRVASIRALATAVARSAYTFPGAQPPLSEGVRQRGRNVRRQPRQVGQLPQLTTPVCDTKTTPVGRGRHPGSCWATLHLKCLPDWNHGPPKYRYSSHDWHLANSKAVSYQVPRKKSRQVTRRVARSPLGHPCPAD